MHHSTKTQIAEALIGVVQAIDLAAKAADEQNLLESYAALNDGMIEVRSRLTSVLVAENERALQAVAV